MSGLELCGEEGLVLVIVLGLVITRDELLCQARGERRAQALKSRDGGTVAVFVTHRRLHPPRGGDLYVLPGEGSQRGRRRGAGLT
jgi:hypothetical protein